MTEKIGYVFIVVGAVWWLVSIVKYWMLEEETYYAA